MRKLPMLNRPKADSHYPEESKDFLILGFDIGGTKIGAVLGTSDGRIIGHREAPTPADQPFETAFEYMVSTAAEVLSIAAKKSHPSPQAISVAVGGPLDIEKGTIFSPPHLPTWNVVTLKQRLENYFQLPVFVEHDGNAGALAEFYFGAGREMRNLVFLTMGTGLGAGIILDGKIYHGTTDSAGEVGHVRVAEYGPVEYGKAGSWESFCSGAGIAKLARQVAPQYWPEGTSTQQIVQGALTGDPQAVQLVEQVGIWLGKGIAMLVDILNPEVVVVGTLGVVLGDLLLEPARFAMHQEALPRAAKACRIVPAALGDSLGNVSALMAVIDVVHYRPWELRPPGSAQRQMLESLESGLNVRRLTIQKLGDAISATAELIVRVLRGGGKVLVFGNGGSAALAQHLAGELVGRFEAERRPLPALALTADSSVITCIANDYAFDQVFARQVRALAQSDDLAIGLTTGGRSPDILAALKTAREGGLHTIALTGEGGLAEPVADHVLAIPSLVTARIQEEHNAVIHAWCEFIDKVMSVKLY